MRYKNSDDNRYRVQFMRSTEELGVSRRTLRTDIAVSKESVSR